MTSKERLVCQIIIQLSLQMKSSILTMIAQHFIYLLQASVNQQSSLHLQYDMYLFFVFFHRPHSSSSQGVRKVASQYLFQFTKIENNSIFNNMQFIGRQTWHVSLLCL